MIGMFTIYQLVIRISQPSTVSMEYQYPAPKFFPCWTSILAGGDQWDLKEETIASFCLKIWSMLANRSMGNQHQYLYIHYIYIIYTLYIHYIYIIYTLYIRNIYIYIYHYLYVYNSFALSWCSDMLQKHRNTHLLFKQPVHGFQIQILVCIFSITLFLTRTLAMFSQCSHMTLSYAFNHFLTYSRFVSHILRICSNNFPYILPNYDQNMPHISPTFSHMFQCVPHFFSISSLDFSSNSPSFP